MVEKLVVRENIGQSNFRFRNVNDYEHYIKAIDQGSEIEDKKFHPFFLYKRQPSKTIT